MSEAVRPAIGHKKHIASVEYWAGVGHGQRGDELREAAAFIAAQHAELERLRAALVWALGVDHDFPMRQHGDGPYAYWWRKELAQRAGVHWDGSVFKRSRA